MTCSSAQVTGTDFTNFQTLLGAAARAGTIDAALGLFLTKFKSWLVNRVADGVIAKAPTTASTQATGSTGATAARIDLTSGMVVVNGQSKEFALEADRVLHDTTVYTGADAGAGTTTLTGTKKAIITVVAASDSATYGSGAITLINCKGATHDTAPVECTDAEIQTKVGAGLPWVKVCKVQINRTGDTTITQSQDSTVRPLLGVNHDASFWGTVA